MSRVRPSVHTSVVKKPVVDSTSIWLRINSFHVVVFLRSRGGGRERCLVDLTEHLVEVFGHAGWSFGGEFSLHHARLLTAWWSKMKGVSRTRVPRRYSCVDRITAAAILIIRSRMCAPYDGALPSNLRKPDLLIASLRVRK
jgi:hypothetical protein